MEYLLELASRYKTELYWLGWLSAGTLIVSLALIPVLASRIPADYFLISNNVAGRGRSWQSIFFSCIRNLIALMLLLAGLAMLLLPGQGLLTILMALFVADLPGKQRLERKLAGHSRLLASLNWIRAQRGVAPLSPPSGQHCSGN